MYKSKNIINFYKLKTVGENLYLIIPHFFEGVMLSFNSILLFSKVENLFKISKFLKLHNQFNYLLDITCSDKLELLNRFNCQYFIRNLFDLKYNKQNINLINVRVILADFEKCLSVAKLFSSALIAEREIWDMFGVFFINHPDIRRLLNDYGFIGYPLRRDFPLSGYIEVRYDDAKQRIVTEPVELTQEYRNFDFLNPWHN